MASFGKKVQIAPYSYFYNMSKRKAKRNSGEANDPVLVPTKVNEVTFSNSKMRVKLYSEQDRPTQKRSEQLRIASDKRLYLFQP